MQQADSSCDRARLILSNTPRERKRKGHQAAANAHIRFRGSVRQLTITDQEFAVAKIYVSFCGNHVCTTHVGEANREDNADGASPAD